MANARYFIHIDTYWTNSPNYFVGPFASREEAQAAIDNIPTEDNCWLSTSHCGGDIRSAVRVYPRVLSATEAKKAGMREGGFEDNILSRIPRNTYDLA